MTNFKDFTDKDLMKLLQEATELRDGRYIRGIKEEMHRRNRDE